MKRSISPFLTVYRPQWTSMLSIMERVTGIFLFLVLIVVLLLNKLSVGLSFYSIYSIVYFINKGGFFMDCIIIFVIYIMVYHIVFGVRYLYWYIQSARDIQLNLENYYKESKYLLILTGIIGLLLYSII